MIARASGSVGGGSDESYDGIIERLKRDLLREREQSGFLAGDLPW